MDTRSLTESETKLALELIRKLSSDMDATHIEDLVLEAKEMVEWIDRRDKATPAQPTMEHFFIDFTGNADMTMLVVTIKAKGWPDHPNNHVKLFKNFKGRKEPTLIHWQPGSAYGPDLAMNLGEAIVMASIIAKKLDAATCWTDFDHSEFSGGKNALVSLGGPTEKMP